MLNEAIKIVSEWLDSQEDTIVTSALQVNRNGKRKNSWKFNINDYELKISSFQLRLPDDFPFKPAQIYLDSSLFLELPHVEEDGLVCLGITFSEIDITNPLATIERTLISFKDYISKCYDRDWRQAEFQRERLSYWNRYCSYVQNKSSHKMPLRIRANIATSETISNGNFTIVFPKKDSKEKGITVAVTNTNRDLPSEIISRHHWADGQIVKGDALFFKLDHEIPWIPTSWPNTIPNFISLIKSISDNEFDILSWVQNGKNTKNKGTPKLVILYEEYASYGFWIVANFIYPAIVCRIDSVWTLTRNQNNPIFKRRQNSKIAILGCGSLGSPIAELLARAGIGKLCLIDDDTFESENCSRHILGINQIRRKKADAILKKIKSEIPDIAIISKVCTASEWIIAENEYKEYDLIVDCTGECTVRTFLHDHRQKNNEKYPIVHVWMEPFSSATHVVAILENDSWKDDNRSVEKINVFSWPNDGLKIKLPICGSGFHDYGSSDATQAAAFATERILSIVDKGFSQSVVWSWVRSNSFVLSRFPEAIPGPLVPITDDVFECRTYFRDYTMVVIND